MYRKVETEPKEVNTFELPFEGKLCEENRWVIMSKLIPWAELEEEYAKNFAQKMGAPGKSLRMALGALIIKEKLGISDRETVEQIKENPYLQYFIGQESYSNQAPFDPSMMVHFREKIGLELANKVNQKMVKKAREEEKKIPKKKKKMKSKIEAESC